jgi:NAD(P)-dependent dehydrogenase (short-subunit alcohol dehydrogenase family)
MQPVSQWIACPEDPFGVGAEVLPGEQPEDRPAVNGRPGDEQVAAIGRAICADGGAAAGFCADVTDEGQVAGLVAAIAGRLGPVGVLVLNATGPQPEAAVTEVTWAGHLAQLDFFVKSPVLLGRAVLPAMQARRYGRIVHIDSEVAHRPPPGRSAYATAKSAQIGLWSATPMSLPASRRPVSHRCPPDGWGPPATSPTP